MHIPVIQIIGGLLFAISYEREKNILAPVVIHVSANLSLCTIAHVMSFYTT